MTRPLTYIITGTCRRCGEADELWANYCARCWRARYSRSHRRTWRQEIARWVRSGFPRWWERFSDERVWVQPIALIAFLTTILILAWRI
jgi:hypothetical protein